ncbi:hypothetical protein SUNI508_06671 [Seiridium unicorne]|uniref:Uncharacterized protein n=1 Tax=Seiridium unicorne TaxID=138068 RepID=A0ABR2UZL0_9PEZI
MDAPQDKKDLPHLGGYSAPPALPDQVQPWKKWFGANDLDTNKQNPDDTKPQQCKGNTQAATNIVRIRLAILRTSTSEDAPIV